MNDLKRLLLFVRPYWVLFLFAFFAMVMVALFETATGALLVPIFNQFVPTPTSSATLFDLSRFIPRDDWFRSWIAISVLLVVFTVCKGIAEYFSSFLMAKIGQSAVLKLRQDLYEHLLRQSAAFFEKHRTNFLVSRLVVSCAAIELAVSANLRDVLRESLMLIFFFSAAFYYNWRLTFGALIIAPMIGILTTKFSSRLRKLAEISVQGNKSLTDTAQEAIANLAIVKAYTAEDREKGRFATLARLIANSNLRSGKISAISPPIIDLIGVTSIVGLLYFGLREIHNAQMDAAQFFTSIFFLLRSYDPMRKISRQHNEISRAFAAARDVWDILDVDEMVPENPGAGPLLPLERSIVLEGLSFNYQNNETKILRGVDLEIPRGSMVALVGESGGGKSSLIKLVQRLYDPTEGRILWDGTDIRDVQVMSLKKQLALVTQETVLFNDTIRYNISYGKPDATDAEIAEAARVAFADEFIDALPDRYDTIVGERGTMLSGGQRQRIAIARAVLVNAPVLILDEATSALDTESERLVQRALANLTQNKTSIVIAHRLSTIRRADRIVVMEKGEIVESGTHDELLEQGGRYKKLYDVQFITEEDMSEDDTS